MLKESRASSKALIIACLIALGLDHTLALRNATQLGYTINSIDYLAASSDVVVIGPVDKVSHARRPSITRDPAWAMVTLNAPVILKGRTNGKVLIAILEGKEGDLIDQWRESKEEVLWFLNYRPVTQEATSRVVGELDRALWPNGDLGSAAVAFGKKGVERVLLARPVLTMNFQQIRYGDEVVKHVKSFAAKLPNRIVRAIHVPIPGRIAALVGRLGDANALVVPACSELEAMAKEWLEAESRASSRTHVSTWLRFAAIDVLREFKSSGNIELLKSLLADDTFIVDTSGTQKVRFYRVREKAYSALKSWNVPVTKPLIRVPIGDVSAVLMGVIHR